MDDLASGGESEAALATALSQAIEFYQDENFWFRRTSASASTLGGSHITAIPSALRFVQSVAYLGGLLGKVPLDRIEGTTSTGSPSEWAEDGGAFAISPIPDATYALTLYGIASVSLPATDGDSNVWTTEAYDL